MMNPLVVLTFLEVQRSSSCSEKPVKPCMHASINSKITNQTKIIVIYSRSITNYRLILVATRDCFDKGAFATLGCQYSTDVAPPLLNKGAQPTMVGYPLDDWTLRRRDVVSV